MSISDADNAFAHWIAAELAVGGPFVALVVLFAPDQDRLLPLCSTYFAVDEPMAWDDIALWFAGAGEPWQAAAFFVERGMGGQAVAPPQARLRLKAIEASGAAALRQAAIVVDPAGARMVRADDCDRIETEAKS